MRSTGDAATGQASLNGTEDLLDDATGEAIRP